MVSLLKFRSNNLNIPLREWLVPSQKQKVYKMSLVYLVPEI